ncbi:hypothetical protein C8R45DRAFT_996397 [Mycena sanguinolenta]|nr:hypothetical protein C8R45DRAFT_996397 [Mycena sanguinolenta]
MAQTSSVVCSILTLPPEIIAEIFSYYMDMPIVCGIFWMGHSPLVLATVCKRWREICFTTCSLWSCVLINDECNWDDEAHLRFLQRWLARAGGHSLDIRLICSETIGVLPTLLRYSSQWRNICLTLDSSNIMALRTVHAPLVSLTSLSIVMPAAKLPATVTAFGEAPSLREVSLSGLGPLQSVTLPWTRLTHLKLSNISLEKCLTILKATLNLELMAISMSSPRFSEPVPSSALMLARLHTLTLTTGSSGLLHHLTLPAIRTLRLPSLTSDWVSRLLELGTRSSWSPRSIKFGYMEHEPCNLLLRSLPSLETVELLACRGHGPILFASTLAPLISLLTTDDAFLPNLCELTIHDYPAQEILCTRLVEMLASRSSLRLKSFHVSFVSTADIALDEVTNRLGVEGLEVVVEPLR